MKEAITYDVGIAGGGLSGLALAILLARGGYRVAVVEKGLYPFHKVCGEYISMESWPFLERLGIPLSALGLPRINRLKVTAASGGALEMELPLGGFGISRHRLDALMADEARRLGVTIIEGLTVKDIRKEEDGFHFVSRAGEVFRSRFAAGAWGKRGAPDLTWQRPFATAGSRGLADWVGVKYHLDYVVPNDLIALHNFYGGYAGISAIEEGKTCFCYLVRGEALRREGSIERLNHEVLSRNPFIKTILADSKSLEGFPITISSISFLPKSTFENGIPMMGDTAGLIAPLCGNGMSMALRSAQFAYQALDKVLRGDEDELTFATDYVHQWQKEFSRRLWVGRTVQRFFGGGRDTETFLRIMQTFPGIGRRIVRATHGDPF